LIYVNQWKLALNVVNGARMNVVVRSSMNALARVIHVVGLSVGVLAVKYFHAMVHAMTDTELASVRNA